MDIKTTYSFSEIGTFLISILEREKIEEANKLSLAWLGNNLSEKGYDEVLVAIKGNKKDDSSSEPSQDEIDKNWRKLSQLMGG